MAASMQIRVLRDVFWPGSPFFRDHELARATAKAPRSTRKLVVAAEIITILSRYQDCR